MCRRFTSNTPPLSYHAEVERECSDKISSDGRLTQWLTADVLDSTRAPAPAVGPAASERHHTKGPLQAVAVHLRVTHARGRLQDDVPACAYHRYCICTTFWPAAANGTAARVPQSAVQAKGSAVAKPPHPHPHNE